MNHFLNRIVILVALATLALATFAIAGRQQASQDPEIEKIESLLTSQDACWNRGDIEAFMDTYWKSDQLTFSGGGETTRGWQATLDRYKTSYPRDQMGQLHFDELETTLLSDSVALVLGQWHLDLNGEKKDGNFSLVMKKFGGEWKIVHDHSSTLEKEKDWLTFQQAVQVGKNHYRGKEVQTRKLERYVQVSPLEENSALPAGTSVYIDRKTAEILTEKPPN